MTRTEDELIDMAEIGRMHGRSAALVRVWRHRGLLPDPITIAGKSPVWRRSQFDGWTPPGSAAEPEPDWEFRR